MQDINRKLEKGFLKINPEITIQKAFEIMADPSISILIYKEDSSNSYYYLTELEINQTFKKGSVKTNKAVKEIAIKSIIFDYDRFLKNHEEYLVEFKKNLSVFGQAKPERFLVISKGKPVGLISDLFIADILDSKEKESKSAIDKFIDSHPEPQKDIEKFYEILLHLGFKLTPGVKKYILKLMDERIMELKNKKPTDELMKPEIILDPASKPKVKSKSSDSSHSTTGLVVTYNPSHIDHRPKGSSPEMPERLIRIMDLLKRREKIFDGQCRLISDYPPATEEDLLRVHTKQYINFIKNYAAKGGGFLGDSTYITKNTHEIALLAVGGAIRAAEEVVAGKAEFGLGLIRPPGHHASREKYGGYCIYNNAAILARYLQNKFGLNKILILDWDAHAANGTMDIFYDDPSVMLISLHQDPHNYYPKTGFISQMGKARGLGYTVNIEMPKGSGDEEYMIAFNELVIPLYKKFEPDFVIGCNGFDSHHSDQFTGLQLTSNGYYKFCTIFRKYLKNKMVILMEGGYNPFMGELTHTLINGLLGQPNQFNDAHQSLIQKVVSDEKIQTVLNKKLKELKYHLTRYHVI